MGKETKQKYRIKQMESETFAVLRSKRLITVQRVLQVFSSLVQMLYALYTYGTHTNVINRDIRGCDVTLKGPFILL